MQLQRIVTATLLALGLVACKTATTTFEDKSIETVRVATNPAEVAKLISRAEAGDARAQLELAAKYLYGEGIPQDPALAFKWMERAAHHGVPAAQFFVGHFYENGEGVDQNLKTAISWYMRAAEQDHPAALYRMGVFYMVEAHYKAEVGVPRDTERGAAYLGRAAELGHTQAQVLFGTFNVVGMWGVEQDVAEGMKWLTIAASRGDEQAKEVIGNNKSKFSKDEIKLGQQRARDWIAAQPDVAETVDQIYTFE